MEDRPGEPKQELPPPKESFPKFEEAHAKSRFSLPPDVESEEETSEELDLETIRAFGKILTDKREAKKFLAAIEENGLVTTAQELGWNLEEMKDLAGAMQGSPLGTIIEKKLKELNFGKQD